MTSDRPGHGAHESLGCAPSRYFSNVVYGRFTHKTGHMTGHMTGHYVPRKLSRDSMTYTHGAHGAHISRSSKELSWESGSSRLVTGTTIMHRLEVYVGKYFGHVPRPMCPEKVAN